MKKKLGILLIFPLFFSLFSFTGQIFSVSLPRWWIVETVIKNITERAHFGLWVTEDCLNEVCTRSSSTAVGDKAWLKGVQVIEVLAVVFLFGAVVMSILSILWRTDEARVLKCSKLFIAFSGAAGVVIVMGVLIFFKKKRGLSPSQAIATKDGSADWALIISSTSGVVSLICSTVIGCKLIMKDDFDDETDYSQYQVKDKDKSGKS